jgi:hypothetical protein
MLYGTRFLLALATTWAIEIPVLFALIRFVFRDRNLSPGKILVTGALCTALTLPYLWFVLPPFVDAAYYPLAGEILVIIAEAGILFLVLGLDTKRAVFCSVLMNAVSFILGLYLL